MRMRMFIVEIDDPNDGYTDGPRWRTVAVCTTEDMAHQIVDEIVLRIPHVVTNIEAIETDTYPMIS